MNDTAIFEAAPDAIVVTDSHVRIARLNPAAERMFGYAARELVGEDIGRLLPDEHAWDAVRSRILAVDDEQARRDFEATARRANGERFQAWLSVGTPRDRDARLVVVSFRDMSAQRAAAMRVRLLEARLAAVGRGVLAAEIATSIAHDINQPLAALAAYAQAAKRLIRRGPQDLGELERICENVDVQARRASDGVRRIREAIGRPAAAAALLDINSVVKEVGAVIEAAACAADTRVRLEYGASLPAVRGEALRIQEVLRSLAANAIEAMSLLPPEQRLLEITTSADTEGRVCIAVTDSGPGVAPSLVERIFDSFVTSGPERVGVGLSIGRATADAHGGALRYDANPGGGAVFTLSLPPHCPGANA